MKVIADRAASWREEVECSECDSILEIDRGDIGVEIATAADMDLQHQADSPFDPIYHQAYPSGDVPTVFVVGCPACKQRMLLDPARIPLWLVDEVVARAKKN